MSTGSGALASGVGLGIGLGVGYGTIAELGRLGTLLLKWRLLPYEYKKDVIAQTLQSILSAEKSSVTGLSTGGMVDVIYDFIDKTIWLSVLIDESIATQMFVQMIQQSIAYAIQHSHAGAIGTVGNVYSGGMYVSPMEATSIGEMMDRQDRYQNAFLFASTGLNIPALGFKMAEGINRRIRDLFERLIRDIEVLADEWNDYVLTYYRQYHTLCREALNNAVTMKEDIVQRAYSLLEHMAHTHLSRITELLDTLEGAKAWYDAGLISEEELNDIATRVYLETNASESDYDDNKNAILSAINSAIGEWDSKVSQALSDIHDSEQLFNSLLKDMLQSVYSTIERIVDGMVEMANINIEDVCAYRNIKPSIELTKATVTPVRPKHTLVKYSLVGLEPEKGEYAKTLVSYTYEVELTAVAVSGYNVISSYILSAE